MEDEIHNRIIYGKVKPKLITGLSRSWPFHIMLNKEVKAVNRGYAEQAFSNQLNKGTPVGGLNRNRKTEPD